MRPLRAILLTLLTCFAAVLLLIVTGCGGLSTPNGPIFNGPAFQNETGWLGADKGKHFLGGMAVATGTRLAGDILMDWTPKQRFWAGCKASATAGVGKELYDKYVMGTWFDPVDAAWTAAGCLLRIDIPIGINRRR